MTLVSEAAAISGLAAGWKLDDAVGTTAVDVGSNSYNLTFSTAKANGPSNVVGITNSTTFASSLQATRSSVSSGLNMSGAVSLMAFVTVNSLFPISESSYYILMGRNNNYQLRLNWNGAISFVVWTSAGVLSFTTNPILQLTKKYQIVGTYNGRTARIYVNGRLIMSKTLVGTISTSTDAVVIGSNNVPSASFDISAAYIYSTTLTYGQVRSLYLVGTTTTPVTDGFSYDYLYNDNPLIAAASQGKYCATCGGARKANQPAIITGSSEESDPDCYGVLGLITPSSVISASSTQADYVAMTERLLWDSFQNYMNKVTDSPKTMYFDGTLLQPVTPGLTGLEIQFAFFASMAFLHHFEGLSPHGWVTKAAIAAVDRLFANQTGTGGLGWSYVPGAYTNDFIMAQAGEAILYLRNAVSASKYKTWVKALELAGTYMLTQPSGAPEDTYYVNGNREAQELAGYWWIYRLTEKQSWLDKYNSQYDFLVDPPAGAKSQYPQPISNYYGFTTVTAATQPDGSDGMGYLEERDPSHTPPTYNQTGYDGYDPNYVMLANSFLTRLWLANRDLKIQKLINMQQNLTMFAKKTDGVTTRINTSTWQMDGTGGSRQNNSGAIVPAACFATKWQMGRNLYSDADLAGIWQANYNTYYGALNGASAGIYRGLNLDLCSTIMASSLYQGLPG